MIVLYNVHEHLRVVSRFPRYMSCYIAENRIPLGQCSSITIHPCSVVMYVREFYLALFSCYVG